MVPRTYRVVQNRRETRDTTTLELTPVDGSGLPFVPGQFNMLYAFGKGEVPISISGDVARPHALTHTVRAVGTVSQALCMMKPGSAVGVRGPFGSSWPVKAAEGSDVLVVAGGIGLAPLRPAFYHLLAHRERYGQVALLYGARTPHELLFVDELEKWRGRFDVEVEVSVDNADSAWHGHVGVVTTLIRRADFDPSETVALVCGPEVMMRFTVFGLLDAGMSKDHVFVSLERNMKCGVGLCGHCQFGPEFVCKDGPVFSYNRIERFFRIREI